MYFARFRRWLRRSVPCVARGLQPQAGYGASAQESPAVALGLLHRRPLRASLAGKHCGAGKDSNSFPLPVTQELLERGEGRYKIFCTPCHGLQGDGNGMIAMRGMKHPPSYHEERLRQVPNGYIYDVIGNGFGAMYGYSAQIPPRDRWAIVAYVRALQLSRNAKVAELPADLREKVMHPGAPKKEGTGSVRETPGGTKE
jgi:mono/diheme cytochrome c family protein